MIVRLIKIAGKYRGWMLLSVLFGVLTVGSGIGLMMTSAYIIALAALHPFLSELQVAIVGVRFFGISRGVFRYLERLFSHETTFRLLKQFRVWFYSALEPLVPARLLQWQSGDLLSRIISDIENLEHLFVRVISPPVVAVIITIAMWGLLGIFHWFFPLVLTLFLILAGLGVPLLTRFFTRGLNRRWVSLNSQLNQMIVDEAQGLSELLVFNREEDHIRKIDQLNREYVRVQKRLFLMEGVNDAAIQLLTGLSVGLIIVLAVPMINAGFLKGVYLSVIVLGTMSAFEAVAGLPTAFQNLDRSVASARRLFEIIDAVPPVKDGSHRLAGGTLPRLVVRNLTFGYHPSEPPVLKDVSLKLHPGKMLALVGLSGAGKSTLWQILVRFLEYEQGSIRLQDEEIKNLVQEEVRQLLAVVPQNPILFSGTIRENLILANPGATEAEIREACQLASIQQFVQSLPRRLDTYVGEQGFTISGGELQRIALARALLKNSPFLVLDEPTANLDAENEKRILQMLLKLKNEKGILLISHRLMGLEITDEILVLQEGKIIERGTHSELLQLNGFYRYLYENQLQMMLLDEVPIT